MVDDFDEALQSGHASGPPGIEPDVPVLRLVVRAVGARREGMRVARMVRAALACAAALFAVGCGSGDERSVARSAFLGDVSQLEPGKGDEPSLLYISDTADFSAYECVVIDPVTVWHASGSSPDRLPGAELRALAERLESAIRRRMQGSIFEVVDEPRAGTLRILVGTHRGWARSDEARPRASARCDRGHHRESRHQDPAVPGALELEVVDAFTGERLAAAIDDRLVAAPGEERATGWQRHHRVARRRGVPRFSRAQARCAALRTPPARRFRPVPGKKEALSKRAAGVRGCASPPLERSHELGNTRSRDRSQ